MPLKMDDSMTPKSSSLKLIHDGFQFGNKPELALKDLQTDQITDLSDVVTLREGIYSPGAVKRYIGQDVARRNYYILALSLANQPASCSAGASFAVMMNAFHQLHSVKSEDPHFSHLCALGAKKVPKITITGRIIPPAKLFPRPSGIFDMCE